MVYCVHYIYSFKLLQHENIWTTVTPVIYKCLQNSKTTWSTFCKEVLQVVQVHLTFKRFISFVHCSRFRWCAIVIWSWYIGNSVLLWHILVHLFVLIPLTSWACVMFLCLRIRWWNRSFGVVHVTKTSVTLEAAEWFGLTSRFEIFGSLRLCCGHVLHVFFPRMCWM